MSTYSAQFIMENGGISPHVHVGSRAFVVGMVTDGWVEDADRVVILRIPSTSERVNTDFQGDARLFTRSEARRWASRE